MKWEMPFLQGNQVHFQKGGTMNTKIAVLVFAFLVFLTAYVADAQQPGKVPTIGYLSQCLVPLGPRPRK